MISRKKNSIYKLLISIMLLAIFVFPAMPATISAKAAEIPMINEEKTIGIGSKYNEGPFYTKSDYYTLMIDNPVKKATYTFTSSNKNVVTVKTKGTKAYLTGVKAGSATITCNQKYKGKTKKIGTCKITVKNSSVFSEYTDEMPMGKVEGYLIVFDYRNFGATYTYSSSSKNFSMKEELKKEEGTNSYSIRQTYTAKEPGTYTITVKETYNKKTRNVGKIKFTVKKATVNDTCELYAGESLDAFYYLIKNYRCDVDYLFYSEDDNVVELYKENDIIYFKGKNVGATTIKIYEDASEPTESKLVGTCKITVNDPKIQSMECYFDDTMTYVGGSNIGFSVEKVPYCAPEAVTVTSSDPKIATVSDIDEYNYGQIIPVSEGTVTITVSCGDFKKTQTITIYSDEDAMYGADDTDSDDEDTSLEDEEMMNEEEDF